MLEMFLDSSVDNIYDGLNINGYTLVRSDHPSNTKRGGVAICYKDHIPVIRRNDVSSLHESLVLEIRLVNNKCFLTSLYRSLSQSKDQFDEFFSSFNMLMSNINDERPLASIIRGDFNARSKNWWSQEITNSQGSRIDTLTSTSGYHQLINLPTHMTNTSSSCIDLNLITEFVIEKSLYADICHHSIVFGKMNLNVPLPPPYTREVWDYNKAGKKISRKV